MGLQLNLIANNAPKIVLNVDRGSVRTVKKDIFWQMMFVKFAMIIVKHAPQLQKLVLLVSQVCSSIMENVFLVIIHVKNAIKELQMFALNVRNHLPLLPKTENASNASKISVCNVPKKIHKFAWVVLLALP